ncbi:MAG: squalene synthase HpnC [Rhodospirillales bacterium]|nr:squalene synthase HpnC [Rhodospirillales bacterium]
MTPPSRHAVETPSGKDAAYENFPVGSWLLPAKLRPHIAAFYAFARAIDDIADNPELAPDDKIKRLELFEDGLLGRRDDPSLRTATRMRQSLAETGVTSDHCLDLVKAFKQDATKLRYRDWNDLMGYCILSAAPVGRYLLDLHGGSRDGYGPSDALCNALQVINHLQDCKEDYLTLDRVYVPLDWMQETGASVEDLRGSAATPALRKVLDRTLRATEGLMILARHLPVGLVSDRLAMESAAIVRIADRLIRLLYARDPLAIRVKLTKPQFLWCCMQGVGEVGRAMLGRRAW